MSLIFGVLQQSKKLVVEYSVAGTYDTTVPAGYTKMTIEGWGGGAPGAGIPAYTAGHQGAGSGAQWVKKVYNNPTAGYALRIVIASGKYGTSGNAGNGNDSSVLYNGLTTIFLAKGGIGATGTLGGLGSTANGIGDIVNAGGNGANGGSNYSGGGGEGGRSTGTGGSGSGTTGGTGGDGGDGGNGFTDPTINRGGDGLVYGAGGGGANNSNTSIVVSFLGGWGSSGKVTITYE